MGLKDNELQGERVFDPREGRLVRKGEVLPSIGKTRTETMCFLEGVEWLVSHLVTFRFAEDQVDHNPDGLKAILGAAVKEAHDRFPPFDEPPSPSKRGERTGL